MSPTTPMAVLSAGLLNVAGRGKNVHRWMGHTVTKTLPTTSSTGMKPPPGSPMWARESAEFSRLSPSTQRWSGGTLTSQIPMQFEGGIVTYDDSLRLTPLTWTIPS